MEHIWKIVLLIVLFITIPRWLWGQGTKTKIALLKGKGMAAANPLFWRETIRYCNKNLHLSLADKPVEITADDEDIFGYPYVFLAAEEDSSFMLLQTALFLEYLLAGGFLHINGDKKLSKVSLREIGKILPDAVYMDFSGDPSGLLSLPPSFRRAGKKEQGACWGLMNEGRRMVLFTSGPLIVGEPGVVADVLAYVFREE